MSIKNGKFIVFEGVGGCGKGTQIRIANKLLLKNKIKVVTTREPGGIPVSEEMRDLIFTLRDKKLIGPEGQMVLFFAARKFWVKSFVKKNIEKGVNVLADRCYPATGAYQGYGEGGNQHQILGISDVVMGKYKPDAVILLDVSTKTSMKRRADSNGDPFDKETVEYFNKIVNGYKQMAKKRWGGLRWYVVDGESSVDEVAESVAKVLEKIYSRKLDRI
jgi:dTMP kinase